LFNGLITILVADHRYHDNGKKEFELRGKKCGDMPYNRKIEDAQFSQLQSEKPKEIDFD
jgi:hypothetical protein